MTGIRKAFGSTRIVHCMDTAIADGEFVVLVGPSGCGASSPLHRFAGLWGNH